FVLAYQPIHEPATRRIGSVEALVRWRLPQRGIVSPSAFIGIAESVGAIHAIGEWMRREACAQLRRWEARHPGLDLRLSLNVSAVELTDARFLPGLNDLLRIAGVDPRRLQFEITESVFLREPGRVADLLREIRATGIRIALDDFGTGYSSLGYLDRYAIDAIKIDQSFVVRMLTHPRTMAIVESIFTLGRTLGIDVIAEGVESEAQLKVLRGMGCRAVQGFLWAEPMSAEGIDALLDGLPEQ
ncbi:MAG: EAL domain-containing protein, partial [Burkholderiaceae bacterium]